MAFTFFKTTVPLSLMWRVISSAAAAEQNLATSLRERCLGGCESGDFVTPFRMCDYSSRYNEFFEEHIGTCFSSRPCHGSGG
jgi:hypothetical protein